MIEPTGSETTWSRHADPYSHFVVSGAPELKWLLAIYGAKQDSPFDVCLDVVDGARTLIVEHEYYDPDYRSDFSEFHSRSFEQLPQHTDRLHFFSDAIDTDDVVHLSPEQRATYLGYIVVRPGSARTTVGRAMLRPPDRLLFDSDISLSELVRVAVKERVVLFGQPLDVVGVPFMQQDSRSLRCAHVAAWICHYVAAVRGFVPRQLTSQLHGSAAQWGGTIRPFPSEGLSEAQLANVLNSVGLPAHRQVIRHLQARWNPDLDDRPSHSVWHRESKAKRDVTENLRTYCARYLNSGLPVLATVAPRPSASPNHVVTIIGQGRLRDNGTVFIFHDDEVGPYQCDRDPIAKDGGGKGKKDKRGWVALFVPLPEKVWVRGEHAEDAATQHIHTLATSDEVDLPSMRAFRKRMEGCDLAIRSYVTPASDYKQSIRHRLGEERATEAAVIVSARMSRFVWVVEVLDRARRDDHADHVLGEVVMDATAADTLDGVVVQHLGGFLSTSETVFVPFAERYSLYQKAIVETAALSDDLSDTEIDRQLIAADNDYRQRYLGIRRQQIDSLECADTPYESGRRTIRAAEVDVAAAPSNGSSSSR